MQYHFEWDPVKAKTNLQKHGVSFEEAAEIFLDPLQLSMPDKQSELEARWITLGNTRVHQLRLVVHTFMTYHQDQVTIRIISARPATRHEQKHYEGS
ncbi:MAG: BrnT family toxin [Methylobacter sp.]|uniref:BrnT family toxin n=1 Tax=Methylobacter sp. TaxID=2051955 RepID=UPI0027308F73|nr:BrnT family toxin [Methylobacter sp.]MDP1663900.1 BrnT family toxin [Methylobacter sp.]MDP1969372.1 BrnT family toxin [Methylobacter sp.]